MASRVNMAGSPYGAVIGVFLANSTESMIQLPSPITCTAQNLRVNAAGTTASRTVTLRVNGSATSLSCSLTTGSPTCSNTGSTVSITAGDLLTYDVSGGTQSGLGVYVSAVCQ